MKIHMAHLRDRATGGGFIHYAVFEAKSRTGSPSNNAELLHQLTSLARAQGLRVDQSALTFMQGGQIRFFGDKPLVKHLSKVGASIRWTHTLDA